MGGFLLLHPPRDEWYALMCFVFFVAALPLKSVPIRAIGQIIVVHESEAGVGLGLDAVLPVLLRFVRLASASSRDPNLALLVSVVKKKNI